MRISSVSIAFGLAITGLAAFAVSQAGLKVGQIKPPKVAGAGQLILPKNTLKNISRISNAEALEAVKNATKTTVQSFNTPIVFTPDNPNPNGNTSLAGNVTMAVCMKGGNWVFDQLGFIMAGAKVPSGAKYALVSANGVWAVNTKEIRIASGSTTSSLTYSSSAPDQFHHMMVIDVAGKSEVGFSVEADPGKGGRIWLGSIEVHFTK